MIITLIAQEKNLGLITLSDHLISILGKEHTAIVGLNYLFKDYTNILKKIDEFKNTKSVLIKYVIPKLKFSGQSISYPNELEFSDIIFYIPTYQEEIMPIVPLKFYKGAELPISIKIKKFYGQ